TMPLAATATIQKNIKTDFGAACNGVANDAPAFMRFNSWARAQSLPITLTIPSGSVCKFASTPNAFAIGVKNLTVSGYGATFTTTQSSFFLGGYAVVQNKGTSALVAAVAAGATSVRLLTPKQSSLFKVGRYVLLTGGDLQGFGYPPNPWVFEYAIVSAIDAAAGVITLTAPLQSRYKSTWPSYPTGSTNIFTASLGGPATLYALHPSWDTVLEYRGLRISGNVQTYTAGRSVTYTDVTFSCSGNAGVSPGSNLTFTANNVTMPCQMEVDKLLNNFTINGGTYDQILFQSSSGATLFTMNNSTATTLNGTPEQSVASNSTISTLLLGATFYGRSKSFSCSNCVIGQVGTAGANEQRADRIYTMSGGVLTVPNSHGPVNWAVPGGNYFFAKYNGTLFNEGVPFRIIDITQDATNTYIHTTLSGGFPKLPTDTSNGLAIYAHPAPRFTCSNCTVSADVIDLSQAPAGATIYSYSKRTYTGNSLPVYRGQNLPIAHVWGTIVSVKISVALPYRGAQAAVTMNALGPYGIGVIKH